MFMTLQGNHYYTDKKENQVFLVAGSGMEELK
jgi:hypothetical protein